MWLGQQNVNNTVGGKEGRKEEKKKRKEESGSVSRELLLFSLSERIRAEESGRILASRRMATNEREKNQQKGD